MARYPVILPAGLVSDDTELAKGGRWGDGVNVRWVRDRAEVIGGFERIFRTDLTGVARGGIAWRDNDGSLNLAFGTHSKLYHWRGGTLTDITPTLALPAIVLGGLLTPSPLAVTDGSAVVTVSHPDHGLVTSDSIVVTGAVAVGRIVPNGTFSVTRIDDDTYTFTFGSPADLAETLGNNPFSVQSASAVVTVTDTAHGIPTGTVVTFSGATAVGGITPNGAFAITVVDANTYTFTFTSTAGSTATGGGNAVVATVPATGGGTAVKIAPQKTFTAGQVNGTGGRGYGTGAYGVGGYGQPSDSEYFPRTWSFGILGQMLVASPRGGTIYLWRNDTGEVAEPITNAPRQVTHMITTPERAIMALGCNKSDGTGFDPRVLRHCDPRVVLPSSSTPGYETWVTDTDNLARERSLEGAGNIVAGRATAYGVFVWTDSEVWDGRYTGTTSPVYDFTKLGQSCGLIGPLAVAVKDQQAIWLTPDLRFVSCLLGGRPADIPCPHRDELEENLAPVQKDKIIGATLSGRGEVWFFYPDSRDGTGLENSRALFFSLADGWWSKSDLARTTFFDAGPATYPVGVSPDGKVYWHERGQSADGGQLSGRLRSAPQYIDSGDKLILVRSFYPDFKSQQGAITLTLVTWEEAQDQAVEHGPFIIGPTDTVIDMDVQARLVAFELEIAAAPAYFRQGVFMFEGKATGRR